MTRAPFLSFLFLILSIYSSLLNHVVVSAQYCSSDQQSLLLQLKDTLIFNTTASQILVTWNHSSDCCSWEGVTCEDGRITGLNLSNESISGGIDDNSTLFNLQYLKSLDLSLNFHLQSIIPSRIGSLTNLTYLNLSFSFYGQIPKEISRLKKLHILDLSNFRSYLGSYLGPYFVTNFGLYFVPFLGPYFSSYLESPNLRMLVQNLTELEELYLDRVNISAPGNEWGQALSSSLPNLRVLSLVGCSLSGPIHQSLAKLHYLSVVRLDYNSFSSQVPKLFGNFSDLTSLQLRSCDLYGTFPEEIFQVPTLRTLDLSNNYLLEGSLPQFSPTSDLEFVMIAGTNFGGRLPTSICNLSRLTLLSLSSCHFSGPIPNSIVKLTQLVHLDLSYNQFIGSIPSFNMSNTHLTTVHLSNNLLRGPIPSFNGSRNLTEIDLSHNQLSGPIPSFNGPRNLIEIDLSHNQLCGPIASAHLEGLFNLVYIDLTNNSFNGNIPSSLFALPSLQIIYLSSNQFSGQLLEFPNAPSPMLAIVDLSSNELQGPIPMSMFKLRNLYYLSLSSNMFNGTIQLNIFQGLTNLEYLDLSYNNISVNGSGISSDISFLPELRYLDLRSCNLRKFPDINKNQMSVQNLDLSDNQIYGEIPNWIWKLGNGSLLFLNLSHNQLVGIQEPYSLDNAYNLHTLDLSFNQLHGMIPILPPQIYYVDLSSNSFTSIPSDIGKNLAQTSYFSLAKNGLTGVIPESVCNAREIQVLDLSNNNLKGMIPTCMFALNQMLALNLRKNNLSGPIPDVLPLDCSLKILDLKGNFLTKRVPKSLANCRALEELDLGNNHIVDTFPMLLKNISTLRVLSLKSNKFYGQITCTESIGAWPMIQVVDVSSNSFSGQLPGQCLTKWHTMMTVKGYGQSQLDHPILESSALPPTESNNQVSGIATGPTQQYENEVSVTNKGLEMELLKIVPNRFTYIDFSSNNFHGEIPKEFGQLISLRGLNLSNNVLSSQIPSSFGNLRQLESLDLSRNHLSGKIPASLSDLYFLGFLNLSYNQLDGRIPTGSQIQTFSADRFEGNQGLCGPPLTPNCPGDIESPETPRDNHSRNKETEWNLISVEIGFFVGFGTVIGPLVFRKRWREWYFDRVEDIAFNILPQTLLRKWLSWKMGSRRGVRTV